MQRNRTELTIDVAALLTPSERVKKQRCDLLIRSGKKSFIRTCRALARYNKYQLYRENYPTFEKYVETEFKISRGRAYQLIAASLLSTWVDIQNERQGRELLQLPEEIRPLAWDIAKGMAKRVAPGKDIPTRIVKAAVSVVVTAIETGGYVDTGNGEMTAIDAALTQEAHEVMMRQRQHIQNNMNGKTTTLVKPVPFALLSANDDELQALFEFPDTPEGEEALRKLKDLYANPEHERRARLVIIELPPKPTFGSEEPAP